MRDWESKLGEFLKLNDRDILRDLGKVSNAVAETLVLEEYEKYRVEQDKNYVSDFDKFANKAIKLVGKSKKKK